MRENDSMWNRVYELRDSYVRHVNRRSKVFRKRPLGTIKLHSSAYQCPWVSYAKMGRVLPDGVVVSDTGDVFNS